MIRGATPSTDPVLRCFVRGIVNIGQLGRLARPALSPSRPTSSHTGVRSNKSMNCWSTALALGFENRLYSSKIDVSDHDCNRRMQPIKHPVRCCPSAQQTAYRLPATHLALVAVDENRVVPFVEDCDEGRADDVFRDVVERLLVAWDAELLKLVSVRSMIGPVATQRTYHELDVLALTPFEIGFGVILQY